MKLQVGSHKWEAVSDVESDLIAILRQFQEPTPSFQKQVHLLCDKIQGLGRRPNAQAVTEFLLDSAYATTGRKLSRPVVSKIVDTPIHRQLRALRQKNKKFDIVIADPPWEYTDKANAGQRGAEHKYPVMKLHDIMELDVERVCSPNCVLMLWGTWPLMSEARAVMRAWGFKFKTCAFVWVKLNKVADTHFIGGGHYTRSNSEYVILGVRGNRLPRASKGVSQVITSHVREHSRKPEEFYAALRQLYDLKGLKVLELFGRSQRRGITVLGNDVQAFADGE